MYYLETEASFDAAHFLAGYDGKCSNIHGHRWRVQARIGGEALQDEGAKRGMLVDFGDLKKDLRREADCLDHCLIIEAGSLKPATLAALKDENFRVLEFDFRPTAENFAFYFYRKMKGMGYPVDSIKVYETPDNCAVFSE